MDKIRALELEVQEILDMLKSDVSSLSWDELDMISSRVDNIVVCMSIFSLETKGMVTEKEAI